MKLQNAVHSFLHMLRLLKKPFHARQGNLETTVLVIPHHHSYYKLSDPRNRTHTCPIGRSTIFLKDSTDQQSSILICGTAYFSTYSNMDPNSMLRKTAHTLLPVESSLLMYVICMRKYCGHEKIYLKILTHFHALRPHEYENLF
jgi:hypothetical protein